MGRKPSSSNAESTRSARGLRCCLAASGKNKPRENKTRPRPRSRAAGPGRPRNWNEALAGAFSFWAGSGPRAGSAPGAGSRAPVPHDGPRPGPALDQGPVRRSTAVGRISRLFRRRLDLALKGKIACLLFGIQRGTASGMSGFRGREGAREGGPYVVRHPRPASGGPGGDVPA